MAKSGGKKRSSSRRPPRSPSNERPSRRHRKSRRSGRHHKPSPYYDGGFEDIVQDLLDEATDVEANHGGQYYLDLAGNVRKVSEKSCTTTVVRTIKNEP